MGYDQLRLTPGAWLDLLGASTGAWRREPMAFAADERQRSGDAGDRSARVLECSSARVLIGGGSPFEGRKTRFVSFRI